ncbi:MAG: molybdate ABC transporter permease subunit [Proteobacteria bacterium]|nr:molybdate ABC transporter permease subunit [Pseudomonadota bacterium]MBU1714195.1 molybdate ABC transporter permease subunit [Pseudomonadota bacterium]
METEPLYLSIKLATVGTVFLLCLAIPVSYCLIYHRFRGIFLAESIIGLPLVLPPTVLGFFLLSAMGPASVLGQIWESIFGHPLVFTFYGIVIAAIIQSLPFAVQPIRAAFEKIDQHLVETAYVLGASKLKTFYRVILPNARSGLVAAAILSFAHIMGEFGVILMVGGAIPGETKVASIAIYECVETMQYQNAWQLSFILMVMSYLVLLLFNYLNKAK